MKRRSFLGLLGGAAVAPFAKADTLPASDGWEWSVHQTEFWQTSPIEIRGLADCYVSDFGTVIIKRT